MALLCFTSFLRKRNWRLRLDRSMVSRSRSVMRPNPVKTMFFTGSRERKTGQHEGGRRTTALSTAATLEQNDEQRQTYVARSLCLPLRRAAP